MCTYRCVLEIDFFICLMVGFLSYPSENITYDSREHDTMESLNGTICITFEHTLYKSRCKSDTSNVSYHIISFHLLVLLQHTHEGKVYIKSYVKMLSDLKHFVGLSSRSIPLYILYN